jgi:Phosphatidylethanolamine-binding protein
MSAAACQAGTPRRRPAGTFRHPGSDIGEPTGVSPPAPPPCRHSPPPAWTALPRSSPAASARQRWWPRRAAAAPRPATQSGRPRSRTSTRVPIAGTQPGRDRAGIGDPDCCAGRDSLAGAAAPESTRQRHSQDGCTGRRPARLCTGLPSSLRSPARCAWAILSLLLIGCGGPAVNGPGQGNPVLLTVTSPDLAGGTFPRKFTCDGANRPPRLQWSTPPSGTQQLAVEMLDPDAPGGTFTHWLIYGCPLASPAWRPCRPVPRKASTTSAGAATGAHARRAAPRIITTSWSSRWTPG